MKKTFIMPSPLSRSRSGPDNWNRKHGRGRPRLHWLALLLLGAASSTVCGQEVKPGLQSRPAGRQRRELQEQWFLRGRSSLAGIGALQRYRAHLQKMQLRADHRLLRAQAGTASLPSSAAVWSPLGPAPVASAASGSGEYNYGWVPAVQPRLRLILRMRRATRFISA